MKARDSGINLPWVKGLKTRVQAGSSGSKNPWGRRVFVGGSDH